MLPIKEFPFLTEKRDSRDLWDEEWKSPTCSGPGRVLCPSVHSSEKYRVKTFAYFLWKSLPSPSPCMSVKHTNNAGDTMEIVW